jgi:phosphatidylglycerophosphate synthase
MNWYRSKGWFVGRLDGIVERLADAGAAPDAITLAAVPVAVVGGAAVLVSPAAPIALLLVPLVAGVRLVLNLLDGALARSTGRSHPRGELYNELADRVADIALLTPVAFVPGAQRETVFLGVLGAVLASFVGITTRAAGGQRLYQGVLSKPGRMILLGAFAVAALVLGPEAWGPFGPILLIGTVATLAERTVAAIRALP